MPFCPKCGSQVTEDAQFCPNCGVAIGKTEPSPIMAQPTASKAPVRRRTFQERMIGAAMLDISVYEEVEADANATTQALVVVLLASIFQGIGSAISQSVRARGAAGISAGFLGGLFSALIAWFIWSFVTYYVGTRVFGGRASYGELLRTIGFSNSPGILGVLSFIPFLGVLIGFGVWVWGLVAMVVAVRQGLDFSTGKAVLTCVVGFIAAVVVLAVLSLIVAIPLFLFG